MVDGLPIEGTFRAHQVPLAVDRAQHPEHLAQLEAWLRSYRPEELFDEQGRLKPELAGAGAQGRAPHGRESARQWRHAAARSAACPIFATTPSTCQHRALGGIGDTHVLGRFLRDVMRLNAGAAEFPHVRPRRDAFQWSGSGVRGDQPPMGGGDTAERRVSRAERAGDGNAQRASVRGLAGGLPAHRPAWTVQLLRGLHPHRRFDVQSARQVAEGHCATARGGARSPR